MKSHRARALKVTVSSNDDSVEMKVRFLAKELGLSDNDLEMIQALGNEALYSADAMARRWQPQPQLRLAVTA